MVFLACSSEEAVEPAVPGPSVESRIATAWVEFEAGNIQGALEDFEAVLAGNPESDEAYLGRAWCQMRAAASVTDLNEARASFTEAVAIDADNLDARAGRAAVNLGLGSGAFADSDFVLQRDPEYSFSHFRQFNSSALRIIQAQAQVMQTIPENHTAALQALDGIYESGIDPQNPSSWVVEGLIESSFEAAVMAHLSRMDSLWARGSL